MKVLLMNERIQIQKAVVIADEIGNRKNGWEDYFSCYATISGEDGREEAESGQTVENGTICFTVRYCSAVSGISSTGYRILFRGVIYNIISVDHMNYKKKSMKFRCERARR